MRQHSSPAVQPSPAPGPAAAMPIRSKAAVLQRSQGTVQRRPQAAVFQRTTATVPERPQPAGEDGMPRHTEGTVRSQPVEAGVQFGAQGAVRRAQLPARLLVQGLQRRIKWRKLFLERAKQRFLQQLGSVVLQRRVAVFQLAALVQLCIIILLFLWIRRFFVFLRKRRLLRVSSGIGNYQFVCCQQFFRRRQPKLLGISSIGTCLIRVGLFPGRFISCIGLLWLSSRVSHSSSSGLLWHASGIVSFFRQFQVIGVVGRLWVSAGSGPFFGRPGF
jgi:hypothetical protein